MLDLDSLLNSSGDYFYFGAGSALQGLLSNHLDATRFLVVTSSNTPPAAPLLLPPSTTRTLIDSGADRFASGIYLRRSAKRFQVTIIHGSRAAVGPYEIDSLYVSSDPILDVFRASDDWWDQAKESEESPPFKAGDWVLYVTKGQFARVAAVNKNLVGYAVEIDLNDSRISVLPENLEMLAGDPRLVETWRRQAPSSGAEFLKTITWAKLHYPLSNTLYSFAATRTIFRPYQFLPALKIIKSQRGRILVADEVGLGKTIEAGLIWTELEQREPLKRVLVIAPSSLTTKWRNEMRLRFMREIQIFKIQDLENYLEALKVNPEEPLAAVMSIESLRSREAVLEKLEASEIELDLVILDEAHQVRNKGTRGNILAEAIADISKYLVLLSATPLNLGRDDLFNLMHLLDPHQYPTAEFFRFQVEPNHYLLEAKRLLFAGKNIEAQDQLKQIEGLQFGGQVIMRPGFKALLEHTAKSLLTPAEKAEVNRLTGELHTLSETLNRTRKADTRDFRATRETHTVEVEWTAEEREFYETVYRYYFLKAQKSGHPRAFLMQMPLRQTCSSIPVMVKTLKDKHILPSELLEDDDLGALERVELEQLTLAGDSRDLKVIAPAVDSKVKSFLKLLTDLKAQGQTKVLVFTFFRGTVEYLTRSLEEAGFRSQGLHGGISPRDRHELIERFRAGDFEVMIANQVGSEGLDFEFCSVLVNYDLPWNPMQVEQRIGRLDRFGQKNERILIYNLIVPGTIETEIFFRLYERIKIFTSTVGDLDRILQESMERISLLAIEPNLSPQQIQERVEREAIAIENDALTRANVEEERENLSILDQLEVEGLDESGPRKGRFVSPPELAGHLEHVARLHEASIRTVSQDLVALELVGSDKLANLLANSRMLDVGTELGHQLVTSTRSKAPIGLVLDSRFVSNNHGLKAPLDIVSSRHPLVRLAQRSLTEPDLLPGRFTDCLIETEKLSGSFLALWSVFETIGVDKKTELWVTAIDLRTGMRASNAEEFLLSEPGLIRSAEVNSRSNVSDEDINVLRAIEDQRFHIAKDFRQAENEALLTSRLSAEMAIEERKFATYERRHDEAVSQGKSQAYINMLRGKRDKSQYRLSELEEEFAKKRQITPYITKVALARVTFRFR